MPFLVKIMCSNSMMHRKDCLSSLTQISWITHTDPHSNVTFLTSVSFKADQRPGNVSLSLFLLADHFSSCHCALDVTQCRSAERM